MANQLGKFSSHLANLSQPLQELLSYKNSWLWTGRHQQAFVSVKEELSKPVTLAVYEPSADTKISADASSFGLGAVLLQKHQSDWKPVAYASRALTEAECRYAQIEKEGLATTWSCEKFSEYILGKRITVETDHKPLVPILGSKHLDTLPPRLLRFRLRMDRFDYDIVHVPGKELYTADTLSRAPSTCTDDKQVVDEVEEVQLFVNYLTSALPASEDKLTVYYKTQQEDPVCSQVIEYCRSGWPGKYKLYPEMRQYWEHRGNLTIVNDLLLHGCRVVVPAKLQREALGKLHEGHLGILKCRERAKRAVWWPGLSKEIEETVQNCRVCAEHRSSSKEPLMTSKLPPHPWHTIGADLFYMKDVTYLLVMDYFSRYPEVCKLNTTTSSATITAMKAMFSRHGIPHTVRSDNGPQFDSTEFKDFSHHYNFTHTTSSPRYPQSNGFIERGVKTVKKLLLKSDDPYLAMLNYRATPLH